MKELPEANFILDCHEPHVELMEIATRNVWQSRLPMTREIAETLTLPEGFFLVGAGIGVMDQHYFRRSPGGETDGPVAVLNIGGYEFIHCANPPAKGPETPFPNGPQLLRVDKHHSLVFASGREVDVLRLPDGKDYIQVIAESPEGGGIMQKGGVATTEVPLPEGWQLRSVKFIDETIIHLPNPTEAWFFSNGTSFQGPVELP